MTAETVVKRGPGRPRKNPEAVATAPVKRGPGRPRKNPEAAAEPVKRGPGRPKGSKNKPKVAAPEAPATTAPSAEAPVKRGPGRPKGSKNKPKVTAVAPSTTNVAPPVKRGPGRPKGSKNKPKETTVATATVPVTKRGPGRPRKNPVATGTATATSARRATSSRVSGHTRQVLINPFSAGDVVSIPRGATFTSSAPTLKGRQVVKRSHTVTVVDTIPAHIQPRNSEKGSKVLVRPSRIRAKGSGNYWKDITLTEKILKFNGMNATYETVNVGNIEKAAAPAVVEATAPEATATQEEMEARSHEPMFSASA